MASLGTKIVGLKHRAVTPEFLRTLVGSSIILQAEPENDHDRFALKAIFNGIHFGYIEKEKSEYITTLLANDVSPKIKVLSFDEFKVSIQIVFDTTQEQVSFRPLPKGNAAGIYCLRFKISDTPVVYIGQSNNINKRLQQHFATLTALKHHNPTMQSAWESNKSSFTTQILHLAPDDLSSFELQVWLFEKELLFIEKNLDFAVNAIDGDLVFTKRALLEFEKLIKLTLTQIKLQRQIYVERKNQVGQEIIDKGIIKEGIFGRVNPDIIKASNILTWLNKTRYGWLDYRPSIDTNNSFYKPLLKKIKEEQEKVAAIDSDKWFLNHFVAEEIKNKEKYQTCELQVLTRVRKIFNKYIGMAAIEHLELKSKLSKSKVGLDNPIDNASHTNIKRGHYQHDSKAQKEWENNYGASDNKTKTIVENPPNPEPSKDKIAKSEMNPTSSFRETMVQPIKTEGYSNQDWQDLKAALATLKKPLKIKKPTVKTINLTSDEDKTVSSSVDVPTKKELESIKLAYLEAIKKPNSKSRSEKLKEIALMQRYLNTKK